MTASSDLVLPATLTHAQAAKVLQQIEAALLSANSACVLDASALNHFDSSALAVLLGACRTASQRSLGLGIVGLPPRALQLAKLYGLSDILSDHAPQAVTH